MRKIIPITFALLSFPGLSARAGELPPGAALVKTVQWQSEKLPPEAKLNGGGPDGAGYITVSNAEQKPASVALWESNQPGIQTKWYAVRGKIRYRGVGGVGYLDLWSTFSGNAPEEKARYFSRTLAKRGPMQQITGTSEWRDIFLPFDGTDARTPPSGLELNLILAGTGTVDITDLQVLQFADAPSMWAAVGTSAGGLWNSTLPHWIFGTAIGLMTLAAAAAIVVLAIVFRRKKRNELRRMRALDLA
jgi:hypothetical protein